MKYVSFAGVAFGLLMAVPAQAQEQAQELEAEIAVESAAGGIVATYTGAKRITAQTVGVNGAVVRANPYRCRYAVDLVVERVGSVGDDIEVRRSLKSENVIVGVEPGRCTSGIVESDIEREIERRARDFEREFEKLIERDRKELIAEVEKAAGKQ